MPLIVGSYCVRPGVQLIAWWVAVLTFGHTIAHIFNFALQPDVSGVCGFAGRMG